MNTLIFKSNYGAGTIKPAEAALFAKENGMRRVILCDDNFSGFMEFYNETKKQELTPVFGLEKVINGLNVIIIIKNKDGYYHLVEKFSTEITLRDLNHKDLHIIVNGFEKEEDLQGLELLNADIMAGKSDNVEAYIKSRILYENKGQRTVRGNFVPFIPNANAYRAYVTLQGIRNKTSYVQEDTMSQADYHSLEDFLNKGVNLDDIDAVDDYDFGHPNAPRFVFTEDVAKELGLPEDTTDDTLFEHLSKVGLEERLTLIPEDKHDAYRARLSYEIEIIHSMGFSGYMLIVADFVQAAKDMDIPVGPGRGSAAGSLVAYALQITNIDPIPYGLLFERFLNPERVSMPDIDMDFCQTNRQRVIEYVEKKYGKEKVAQIITFSKLGGKSAIKDTARMMGHPTHKQAEYAALIPDGVSSLAKAEKENEEKISEARENLSVDRVWKNARAMENLIKNYGVHAAGLIISDEPVYKKAPVKKVGEATVLEYDGNYTEDVDLIKFDFLGLKTLSVIDEAMKMVERNHGKKIDIDNIDFDDKKVLELISTGNTFGIFQIESAGMQALCSRLKPSRFEDLVAILALYRPGPMESGMLDDFVDRKNGVAEVSYFFDEMEELLKPILEPTYGVIVYQEQVMQIVQAIGGFSLGEADVIRRAMGKKKIEYMKEKAIEFADGAVKQGFKRENAEELFDLIIKFAGYGFNKSHSAAYAMISCQTAYLKTYYPAEFMASLMNFGSDVDKVAEYIQDARSFGIEVQKPHINRLSENFDAIDAKTISYGMSNIKGVGSAAKKFIKERRENGNFNSIEELYERYPKLQKKIIVGLLNSGALDEFVSNRKQALEAFIGKGETNTSYTIAEMLELEMSFTGEYITNPFEKVERYISGYKIPSYDTIDDDGAVTLAYPSNHVLRTAKSSGKEFSILNIHYDGLTVEAAAFGKVSDQLKDLDLTRPYIMRVVKGENGFIVNSVHTFSVANLEKKFFKK